MPIVSGQRLWNRQQINVPVGSTDVPHGLLQQNLSIDPSLAASIMVIPLPPTGNWANITTGEPTASIVPFSNSGGGNVDLNVLFWLPHTMMGPGDAAAYLPPCFEATTLVWTPSGAVPIFQLKVNDEVLAWNTRTKRVSPRKITQVHKQASDHLRVIGDLRTTDNHPFLVEGDRWAPIGGLVAEDHIRSITGIEVVGPTERIACDVEVYNIEVDELHTYLVGERKLIVHNK